MSRRVKRFRLNSMSSVFISVCQYVDFCDISKVGCHLWCAVTCVCALICKCRITHLWFKCSVGLSITQQIRWDLCCWMLWYLEILAVRLNKQNKHCVSVPKPQKNRVPAQNEALSQHNVALYSHSHSCVCSGSPWAHTH